MAMILPETLRLSSILAPPHPMPPIHVMFPCTFLF
jgi:hypothetical protein